MLLLALALAAQAGPYDADPKHPWNELHQALFTWRPLTTRDKIPAGLEADPLFWPIGADEWTFSAALLPVLDRILEKNGDTLVKDPLKRAMLQHDLWMFFDGLEGIPMGGGRTMSPEDGVARDGAKRRIARLMRRLALTPEEIRALPDNFAAAAASGRHAAAFDPADAERPFLPADLADPKGPWVLLGRADGAPAAEIHVQYFRGRSIFLLYASLPDGREATLDYFQKLAALKRAPKPENSPPGTRFLLLRRSMLLDAEGRPTLTPLTEEVRMRVSLTEPRRGPAGVFEFHLNRSDLFSGVAGGLRAAGPTEEAVLLFFHRLTSKEPIRRSCAECHGFKATPASALRFAARDRQTLQDYVSGLALKSSTVETETEATLKWKQKDKSWSILREFWPKE